MLRAVLPLLLATVGLLQPALADEQLASRWSPAPIVVDGDADEWRGIVFQYFDNDNSALGIMNDADNLYLIVLSRDEATIRQMERRGVTVWISPDGKKKKQYGLRYRGGMAKARMDQRERAGDARPPQMPEGREEIREEQARLRKIIEVFDNKQTREIPAAGEQGPAAATAFGNDVYSCEFLIPITADSGRYSLRLTEPGNLALGIHIGYVSDADKAQMKERFKERDGEPRMGGMPPGGFGGGGMTGGRPPQMRRDAEKKEFWIAVDLARKPE